MTKRTRRNPSPAFKAKVRVGAWIGCWWRLLSPLAYQLTRAEAGMPSLVIRLSTLHPILASVF
jgi:hypothetical protein